MRLVGQSLIFAQPLRRLNLKADRTGPDRTGPGRRGCATTRGARFRGGEPTPVTAQCGAVDDVAEALAPDYWYARASAFEAMLTLLGPAECGRAA